MNMTNKIFLICLLLTASLAAAAEDRNLTPSPDSTMVAFTRGNDLWVRCLADSSETRLTSDGTELILNGYASWVYYEERYGLHFADALLSFPDYGDVEIGAKVCLDALTTPRCRCSRYSRLSARAARSR